jgi:hypothetical protein
MTYLIICFMYLPIFLTENNVVYHSIMGNLTLWVFVQGEGKECLFNNYLS